MIGILTYSGWGISRKWRANRAAYASVGVMSMLAFMSIALDRISSQQLSLLVVNDMSSHQLWSATRVLFGLGILVSVLQTQILVARILQDRRREFTTLTGIGMSKWTIVLLATVEHTGHTLVGVGVGVIGSVALLNLARLLPGTSGVVEAGNWWLPLLFSGALPLVAVLPLTTVLAAKLSRVASQE